MSGQRVIFPPTNFVPQDFIHPIDFVFEVVNYGKRKARRFDDVILNEKLLTVSLRHRRWWRIRLSPIFANHTNAMQPTDGCNKQQQTTTHKAKLVFVFTDFNYYFITKLYPLQIHST
jgi:hypothetical protein